VFKYGINLLYITFFEIIMTILIYTIALKPDSVIAIIHPLIQLILLIQFIISLYFIYIGYIKEYKKSS
jgi:hypothetical protein